MKAITLWEPWATLIANGYKRFETRSWSTRYRGLIAIHASKRWQRDQVLTLGTLIKAYPELDVYADYDWPLGCVVAACRLVAVHRVEDIRERIRPLENGLGDYSAGRFAWELDVVRLPKSPIPAKGAQGIWDWNYRSQDDL